MLLESFLNNSIKWLHADKQKQRIFVSPIKKVFTQTEKIEFRASIYDETLSSRNDANIIITASNGKESYDFELTNVGNGIYEGDLNISEAGNYTYKSKIELDDTFIDGTTGKFIISDIKIEYKDYVLNKKYLKFISNTTSGKSFEISANNAKCFLNPIVGPSGVSAGQNLPHCVACNSLASKFSCAVDSGLTTL